MSVNAIKDSGGGFSIRAPFNGQQHELMYVRPTGLLQMGEFFKDSPPFSRKWAPDLIAAVQMARQLSAAPHTVPWDAEVEEVPCPSANLTPDSSSESASSS